MNEQGYSICTWAWVRQATSILTGILAEKKMWLVICVSGKKPVNLGERLMLLITMVLHVLVFFDGGRQWKQCSYYFEDYIISAIRELLFTSQCLSNFPLLLLRMFQHMLEFTAPKSCKENLINASPLKSQICCLTLCRLKAVETILSRDLW